MIDKVKYQHQIIDEIYGFDNENKIGKDIRLEVLKYVIGDNLRNISLRVFQSNNGDVKSEYASIKNDNGSIYISSYNNGWKRCLITKESSDTCVCKSLITDSKDFWFCQEILLYSDVNNPFYTIVTKCIDHGTYVLFGDKDISDLQCSQRFGFSWDAELSNDFNYLDSHKVIEDLRDERDRAYNKIKGQDNELVLERK